MGRGGQNLSGEHYLVFAVLSVSSMIEAYVYSIAYIATSWVSVPRYLIALLSVWPPLWLLIGGALMGPISDLIGRRGSMYLSLIIYVASALGLILSTDYAMLLTSLALLMLAIGGDYNTVLTAMHEYFPGSVRGRLAYLILNFTNLGGAVAASLALASPSVPMQRLALGVTLVVTIPILYLLRTRIPESPRWLIIARRQVTSSGNAGFSLPSLWLRVAIGGLVGWAYTAGFTLLALTLGPYYLPTLTNWLILAFSLASFLSGIPVSLLADGWGRRTTLLVSSIGTVVTSLIMALSIDALIHTPALFWSLFALFSVFVNTYFLTEDTLKSEYWVTRRRGSFTAIVRVISLGGSIPVVFLVSYLPMNIYLMVDATIFGVGLAVALTWYLIGVETGRGVGVEAWDYER